MKSVLKFFLSLCTFLTCLFSSRANAEDVEKEIVAHYMPWYSSKTVSGGWGWHWSMNHFNPDKIGVNGQREAASHDYPLIGLYDSNDPDALECHVLLMKFAGIDGVIIDWYGRQKFRDYAQIHRNTKQLIKYIRRAGLKFAICYEDQSVKHMIGAKFLEQKTDVAEGKKELQWLDKNWFGDKAYLSIDGRPLLLVFGPQYFKKDQWAEILSGLSNRPVMSALPHLAEKSGFKSAFGWPPIHGGRKIEPAVWRKYLQSLYSNRANHKSNVAIAFPGFHDIYKQAKLHDSYGFIDARDGKTFAETFDLAWKSDARVIQIATWNDFGEGTMIEPTKSNGYKYLEFVQKRVKSRPKTKSTFVASDLRLPVLLYQQKKQNKGNSAATKDLEKATALLFDSKIDQARRLIEKHVAKGK